MSRRTWLIFPVALVAFAVLASVAALMGSAVSRVILPQRPAEDQVSVTLTEDYTLSDTVEGDLFVTGGVINLTADSHVVGNVSLVGEEVTVAGRIDGDLTVISGSVIIVAASAQIEGDALIFGDNISIENASVGGDLDASGNNVNLTEGEVRAGSVTICSGDPDSPCQLPVTPPEATPFTALWSGLTLAGAAGLAVVVFPRHIGRMEDAIRRDTRKLTVMGFGVLMLAGGVTAVWLWLVAAVPPLGVLLIPVYGIAALGFGVVIVSGWITLSLLLGDVLMRGVLRVTLPALIEAIIGMALLSGVLYGVSLIPFGAFAALPLLFVLTSVGVGAAMSTRLGRRPLRGARLVQG